ncbi:MAG: glycosyltransferase family 9 protein [bacterium]
MKRIALINFGGIGDEILFLPTIKSVKETYPNSEITLVVEPRSKSIKDLTHMINKIIECDIKSEFRIFEVLKLILKLRQNKFDMIISSGASPLISVILFLSGINNRYGYNTGALSRILLTKAIKLNKRQYAANMYHDLVSGICDLPAELPEIEIDNTYHTDPLATNIEIPTDKKIVLIHPGSSKLSKEKNIIKSYDNWAELIKKLQDTDKYTILLAGGPDDKEVVEEIIKNIDEKNFINLFGKTKNIKQLVKLMKKSDLCICIDSAPMHIAVGIKKKLIGIFGPTDEKKLLPEDKLFTPITNVVRCRPCLWDKRDESCENVNCLKIPVDKVFKAIEDLLS